MKRKKYISEKTETENEKQNEPSFYRLIFVGDNEVGKTQIINNYNNKIYEEEYYPTYCIDFQIKTVQIDGKIVNIHCIDTQGSSDFVEDTGTLFIQKSDAFIYVFDITSIESFNNLKSYNEKIKLALTDSHTMIKEKSAYLVGNKCDLISFRRINENEARLEATKYKAKYFEVSAKTGFNIDGLFGYIIKDLIRKEQERDSSSYDSGGGIMHKSIYNNNNINNTNIINNNNLNNININRDNNIYSENSSNINSNSNTNNNISTNNNNMLENEKSGLNYDSSTYILKSNMAVNKNNDLLKNINNPEVNSKKEELKNSKVPNNFSNKCYIF